MAQFAAGGPNPVLIYFLESTARAMAEITGGSPFVTSATASARPRAARGCRWRSSPPEGPIRC
ncbi:hypothetical protein CNY89_18115 [Amaricoccus sp. HAR-UPW-R2A-40]|nr:hypothetical protein CNY89_18115 [Amaricoccus sp. HAR-UPW-R2A-40]